MIRFVLYSFSSFSFGVLTDLHRQQPVARVARFYLQDAAGEVLLLDAAEGTLVLVALPSLRLALVVYDYQRHTRCPEGIQVLVVKPDNIARIPGIAL